MQTTGLAGFGLDGHPCAIGAAGALVQYLRDTQKGDLTHVRSLAYRETRDGLIIDATTLRHLEVLASTEGDRQVSLLGVLDETVTAMGARLLRAWLTKPLVALDAIRDRLDAVEDLAFRSMERGSLRETLAEVHDVQRLVARAALGTAGPRDLVALARSLAAVPGLRQTLGTLQAPLLAHLCVALDDLPALRERITATLADDPPMLARDGDVVRDGADPEVDRLRHLSRSGKGDISAMEEAERQRTGISSLKIRFNRVFGYYIEISRSNLHAVPADYIRKQTIAGGERFITPALKTYEEQVLHADEHLVTLEVAIFEALRREVATHAPALQRTAHALATLDVLATFADGAARRNYSKPHLHDGDDLSIVEGRHPVVETMTRDAFVPNDLSLDGTTQQLLVITGPNMGGKSTYLRQTALLCLMAQAGAFVPARQAKLPVVDRIYARVGAADNIARGQSTFMVEMQETASILNTATSRSLVVLDEIGRGTSTFDGLSIAWAVAEHLATSPKARPKTLFATHYHELTDLADALPGVANAHLLVREWQDQIVFLRKVVPGRSDRSYGIQVARLAGLPGQRDSPRSRDPQRPRTGRTGARRPADDCRRGHPRGPAAAARTVPGAGRRTAARTPARHRRQRAHAAAGADAPRGAQGRGRGMRSHRVPGTGCRVRIASAIACRCLVLLALTLLGAACRERSAQHDPAVIVGIAVGPTNLDPRVGSDEASQRVHQLLHASLVRLDDQLQVVPEVAERLEVEGSDDVRGAPASRRALPRRLDARRGRRRLHVPQLPRQGVPVAAQGRLRPARGGRRRGRAHRRLPPQGALRLVPREPRDGHRPGGYAGRRAGARRRRTLPLRPHAVG